MPPLLNVYLKVTLIMGRDRTGSLYHDEYGWVYGRITWKDASGKRRQRKRKSLSGTKKEARAHIVDLLEELDEEGDTSRSMDGHVLTFKQLADYYEKQYAKDAEFDKHGIKKTGLLSYKDVKRKLKMLCLHFRGRVREISYGDLAAFKRLRLSTPVEVKRRVKGKQGKKVPKTYESEYHPRSIATVNRELAQLRRLLTVAFQHKWIRRNPFHDGDPLINIEEEEPRERIATKEERAALLAACTGEREHLRPLLILAFDTGFRGSEMFRLKVADVNFADNSILAVSYKGRRRRERAFVMTRRLAQEMRVLCDGREPEEWVFTYNNKPLKSVKRSFATVKRIAGLADSNFRLHDARHTAATRLISKGMSLSAAGKLLGHTQPKTTWRYMHVDKSTGIQAAELLEEDD